MSSDQPIAQYLFQRSSNMDNTTNMRGGEKAESSAKIMLDNEHMNLDNSQDSDFITSEDLERDF